MWRLLHENVGDRLLHTRVLFGSVHVRRGEFEKERDELGFTVVNASLPTTWDLADALIPYCPDLSEYSRGNKVRDSVTVLCKDVLEANRKGRQVDPDEYLERLLKD